MFSGKCTAKLEVQLDLRIFQVAAKPAVVVKPAAAAVATKTAVKKPVEEEDSDDDDDDDDDDDSEEEEVKKPVPKPAAKVLFLLSIPQHIVHNTTR